MKQTRFFVTICLRAAFLFLLTINSVVCAAQETEIQQPQYPGGIDALLSFMKTDFDQYNALNQGFVVYEFTVKKDGSLCDDKMLICSDTTIPEFWPNLIQRFPRWIPAKKAGENVDYRCRLYIHYAKRQCKLLSDNDMKHLKRVPVVRWYPYVGVSHAMIETAFRHSTEHLDIHVLNGDTLFTLTNHENASVFTPYKGFFAVNNMNEKLIVETDSIFFLQLLGDDFRHLDQCPVYRYYGITNNGKCSYGIFKQNYQTDSLDDMIEKAFGTWKHFKEFYLEAIKSWLDFKESKHAPKKQTKKLFIK